MPKNPFPITILPVIGVNAVCSASARSAFTFHKSTLPASYLITTLLTIALFFSAPASAHPDYNLWFANDIDTTQIFYNDASRFLVILDTDAGDSSKVDTIAVSLATEQGDRETVRVVETQPASNHYVTAVMMKVIGTEPTPDNGALELDGSGLAQQTVALEASVETDAGPESASMDLGLPKKDGIFRRVKFEGKAYAEASKYCVDGRLVRSARPRGRDPAHRLVFPTAP